MADFNPLPIQTVDPLELEINSRFDQIITKVNARRAQLLRELSERREETRTRDTQRKEMISQLAATKLQVESCLKENPLKNIQQKMIRDLEKELKKLEVNPKRKRIQFSMNSNFIVKSLDSLGEISERISTIYYSSLQPIVAVAKAGTALGEIKEPGVVAIDETNGDIFIAEFSIPRISVFSQTGEFIKSYRTKLFKSPRGMAINKNNIYVSDVNIHVLFQFRIPDLKLIQQVGKRGSGVREFIYPYQLATSPFGDVFVCDFYNNRIQVLNSDLKFQTNITHESMTQPFDVKITEELIYALSLHDNPCMHIFALTGDKIRSILSEGEGMQLTNPSYFCIDPNANIIICNHGDHSIKIFSSEGELCHQIGQQGHDKGMFFKPRGVALTKEGKLICVSDNNNFGLQIFS